MTPENMIRQDRSQIQGGDVKQLFKFSKISLFKYRLGRGLLLHISGIAKVPCMMYINKENKAMGLLA